MMRATERRVSLAALTCAVASAGCYRSHTRSAEPAGDAGESEDAPCVIAPGPRGCPPGYRAIASALTYGPNEMPGLGSLIAYAADGHEVFHDGHTDNRFDLCLCADEGPFDLFFAQDGGSNIFFAVNGDFVGETWGRGGRRAPEDADPGRLERQAPDSRFVVNLGLDLGSVQIIDESPFSAACTDNLSECRIRYIEVAGDGALLGGAAFEHQGGRGHELVLDARGTAVVTGRRFEVELPTDGLLAGVPLTDVRPLDCSGPPGTAQPGELDLWRCSYAGVATVEETDGARARGSFSFVDGPTVTADTLMAHLGSEESGLEAYAFVPCCGEAEHHLSFGRVDRLEGTAGTAPNTSIDVVAPGYEHAFGHVYIFPRYTFWDLDRHGTFRVPAERMPAYYTDRHGGDTDRVIREMWVGAMTTEGAPPWSAGRPVRMVRRRIAP